MALGSDVLMTGLTLSVVVGIVAPPVKGGAVVVEVLAHQQTRLYNGADEFVSHASSPGACPKAHTPTQVPRQQLGSALCAHPRCGARETPR